MQHWPDVVLWGQTVGVIFVVVNTERWKQKRKRNGNIWLLRWCVCWWGGGGGGVYGGWFEQKTRTLLQLLTVSLAWRLDPEMRRRLILHVTGFTRQRSFTSYFIDVEYSLGCLLFICFWTDSVRAVSDDGKYVCGRTLHECIKTRKFNGLDCREITSLPEIKKVIYMLHHFNHCRK